MARTSSKELDQIAKVLSNRTGRDISIGWAYGKPRVEMDRGSRELSPRLPSGQLRDWLYAFDKGLDFCETLRKT